MSQSLHAFHIPVMGTGHSIDTPIRVAPFGITSVISLVDDRLIDQIRHYYAKQFDLPCPPIDPHTPDGRAKRITAYLDLMWEIVHRKLDAIRRLPYGQDNDKAIWFELLPDTSPLKSRYRRLLQLDSGPERTALAAELDAAMEAGDIEANIMVKLDAINFEADGTPMGDTFRDAKAALRGFANSVVRSGIVFSAGINQGLFRYLAQFRDFYRDETGMARKKIILKVNNFRSALIQGKALARQGLEVAEYRIESGLNCGGHAFASDGQLLPTLLQEFRDHREQLTSQFRELVAAFYRKMGWTYPANPPDADPVVTVQGGIATHGETRRMLEDYGLDRTGWGTPFLLVPEATCVDTATLELLQRAERSSLYLSDVSPLGIPFNNLRGTGSERWTHDRIRNGKPGSPCAKGFIAANIDFTERPACVSSRRYQKHRLAEIDALDLPAHEKARLAAKVTEKTCICDHLGNGILVALGLAKEADAPVAICPGPSITWFNRLYTLREMVDHIYGRGPSLVPPERPHVFAEEIRIYVDYFHRLVEDAAGTPEDLARLTTFKDNLLAGMQLCLEIAARPPYPGENLASIPPMVAEQRPRLQAAFEVFQSKCRLPA